MISDNNCNYRAIRDLYICGKINNIGLKNALLLKFITIEQFKYISKIIKRYEF